VCSVVRGGKCSSLLMARAVYRLILERDGDEAEAVDTAVTE
jgi:hypothetical protein